MAQRNLLGRIGERDQPDPFIRNVVRRNRKALLQKRVEQRKLKGDIVVELFGGLDIAVDLAEHLPEPRRLKAFNRRSQRGADNLSKPAAVHAVEQFLPLWQRIIGVLLQTHVFKILFKRFIDCMGPIWMVRDLRRIRQIFEHARVDDLQIDQPLLPNRVERLRDQGFRLRHVIAHIRHAADRAEHLGIRRF